MNIMEEPVSIILSFLITNNKDKYALISKLWYKVFKEIKCKFCFSIYQRFSYKKTIFKCNNCCHILESKYIKEKRKDKISKIPRYNYNNTSIFVIV